MRTLDLREAARRHRPQLAALPHLRKAAIATWRARMINEHGSARVFEALADQLARAGLHDLAPEARSFAAEERHHGVLCGAVVEALGGRACARIDDPIPVPQHEDASQLEAVLRNLLSICCLSETVAVALIGAERREMPRGPLRDLLTRIYADEVGHARFGWRVIAQLAPHLRPAMRERLGDYLVVAFAHLVTHELACLPVTSRPPPEGVVYGLCSGSDARVLFVDTVTRVIIPSLHKHAIPAARAWSAAGADLVAYEGLG